MPIIEVLREFSGAGETDAVLQNVWKRLEKLLNATDKALMPSGEPRWRLQARFERKNMELEGLLKSDSARGWWELSEKGRSYRGVESPHLF
jgi:hypothetical protein